MKKVVIFDFDGTLADTLNTLVKITNSLAPEFGYPTVTQQQLKELQKLNSWQILKLSKISFHKLPCLLQRVKDELQENMTEIDLFPDIKDVVLALKNHGNLLGIITSNSRQTVKYLIEKNHLVSTFDFIYAEASIFGKHKLIKKVIKQEKLQPETIIYIGDEVRDIDAARQAGIKIIAVTWGFNSQATLAAHQPDFIVEKPLDLPAIIDSI
jgi:phosphoglycolate phosphatase